MNENPQSHDPRLWNEDLAPVPQGRRTWTKWNVAALWVGTGAAASLLVVSVQRLTVEAVPTNRGGAASVQSSFRFLGSALAPTVWLPVATRSAPLAFAGAAGGAVLTGAALLAHRRRTGGDGLSATGS